MGKWTSQHYDDVLGSKIKSLVSGSVRRAKLERSEHSISYETFVEDLDAGDSFTTSLVDILVKEVAARRLRESTEDKRLIADTTSKGLRMLSTHARVYRQRRTGYGPVRRSHIMTDYLALPPEEMDMDDDGDSTDSVLEPAVIAAVEGARARTNPVTWEHFAAPSPPPEPVPTLRRASSRTRDSVSPYRPADSVAPSSSLGLHLRTLFDANSGTDGPAQQAIGMWRPSHRRGPRRLSSASVSASASTSASTTRASDFADFSARRRSSARESPAFAGAPPPPGAEDGENETETAQPRRFFPSMRPWTAGGRERDFSSTEFISWLSGTGSASLPPLAPPASLGTHDEPPSSASTPPAFDDVPVPPIPVTAPPAPSPAPPPPVVEVNREVPRLRRGGVRPPEALLSWHVSMRAEGRRRASERERERTAEEPALAALPPPAAGGEPQTSRTVPSGEIS